MPTTTSFFRSIPEAQPGPRNPPLKPATDTMVFDTVQGLWELFSPSSGLKIWARQLERAARQSSAQGAQSAGIAKALEAHRPVWELVGQGVLLLHGDGQEASGLLSWVAKAAQMSYAEVCAEEVVAKFDDWAELLRSSTPLLLHLQSGDWICEFAEHDDDPLFGHQAAHDGSAAAHFRQALAKAMAQELRAHPVVVVLTVQTQDKLANELRGAWQFSRTVSVPHLDSLQLGPLFMTMGHDIPWSIEGKGEVAELGAIVTDLSMDQRFQLLGALRRTAWAEDRSIHLQDVIECRAFGSTQLEPSNSTSPLARWRAAVHEAGHVLAEYLTSDGTSISIYCSILDRGGNCGMGIAVPTRNNPKRTEQGEATYGDLISEIRVCLAGRAAEHLLLGAEEISASGSSSDLERASALAMKMLMRRGLPPNATDAGMPSNLLVVLGKASNCELKHASELARQLLGDQYGWILGKLREREHALRAMAESLAARGRLTGGEMSFLATACQSISASQPDAAGSDVT